MTSRAGSSAIKYVRLKFSQERPSSGGGVSLIDQTQQQRIAVIEEFFATT